MKLRGMAKMGEPDWWQDIVVTKSPPFSIQHIHDDFYWKLIHRVERRSLTIDELARHTQMQWFGLISDAYAREIYGL